MIGDERCALLLMDREEIAALQELLCGKRTVVELGADLRTKIANLTTGDAGIIEIMTVEIRGDKVRNGVRAPNMLPVHRNEVYREVLASGRKLPTGEQKHGRAA